MNNINIENTKIKFAIAAVAVLLAGCGGGGSSGTGSTPITPAIVKTQFPVDATFAALVTSSSSRTLRYTDAKGTLISVDYISVPGGDTSFNGKAAKTSQQTFITKVNGQLTDTGSRTLYFQINPFKILGALADDGTYTVAANQIALPKTGTVGSGGNFFTSTDFASSLSSLVASNTVAAWSIESDTESTAYLCENDILTRNIVNAQPELTGECYKLDASGKVLGMRVSLTFDGQKITFVGQ